jgi:hypothetical protein
MTRRTSAAQSARLTLLCVGWISLLGCQWGCSSRPSPPCGAERSKEGPREVPLPPPTKPPLQVRGGEHLEGLHPSLERRARLLYERAEAEGIQLRFISGYRPYKQRASRSRSTSLASWHNFGLAFDVNLQGRAGLSDALKNMREDRPRWDRVGALALELGLTWGEPWGLDEIFHFEWHPGHPDAIRAPTLNTLKGSAEGGDLRGGYQGVWRLILEEETR